MHTIPISTDGRPILNTLWHPRGSHGRCGKRFEWEITIAELLSGQGCATGIWGKWHLGSAEERFPTHQGFDEWYGIPRTYDETFWPSLNEANGLWPSLGVLLRAV